MDKTPAQIERDIKRILEGGSGAYYPGGSGGGGRPARGRLGAGAVIKPHVRTRPTCKKCGRFHTVEEHALHGGRAATGPARVKAKAKTRTKAKARPRKARAKRTARRARTRAKTGTRTRTKAKTKKATKRRRGKIGSTRRGRAHLASLVRKNEKIATRIRETLPTVLSAVRSMPPSGRFGPGDVFISSVYDRVGNKIGMTLDQFKRWLVVQNRLQNLSLHRADMVDAMDPRKVDRSEIDDLGAQFHFIRDRDAREY
jgi:hypothetical protein